MLRLSRYALVATLLLTVAACDSGDPDPTPTPTPTAPTFQIASVVVPLVDGTQGLQFAATPSADVRLVRVDVRNPLGQTEVFSPQDAIVLANESVALQAADEAYVRVSGNWSFRFVGARAAGTQETFDVTVPLTVNAFQDTPSPSNN